MSETNNGVDPRIVPYVDVANQVVSNILDRAETDGDPQIYGHVYGALVGAYMGVVLPLRPIGPADAFLLDVFRSIALSVSGGVQPQRFRDVIKAALSASVHVEAALEAMRAQNAAKGPGTAAERFAADLDAAKPEPAWEGDDEDHQDDPFDTADGTAAEYGQEDKLTPEDEAALHPFRKAPTLADDVARLNDLDKPLPSIAVAAADEDDEARASDEDLIRWTLTPGSDPWGDLLEEPEPGQSSKREMRAGITQAMVQARFDRLHGLLDTSKAPEGVKPEVWEAAKARALPITFGDRGAA